MSMTPDRSELLDLTRDRVREHLSLAECLTERKLDPKHIAYLRNQVKDGAWHACFWAKVKFDGQWFRLNGQHSATMLYNLDEASFPTGQKILMEYYSAESEREILAMFDKFDSPRCVRKPGDHLAVNANIYPELRTMIKSALTRAISAFYLHTNGGEMKKVGANERVRAIHTESVRQWAMFSYPFAKTKKTWRNGFLGGMYACWLVHPAEAMRFFTFVKDDSHEDKKHPSSTLSKHLEFLMSDSEGKAGKSKGHRELYVKTLHAWNAYCDGRSTDLKYYENKAIPRVKTPPWTPAIAV